MNIEKLPKWAKELIESKSRLIGDLQKKVAILSGQQKESPVYFYFRHHMDFDGPKIYVPNETLYFNKKNGTIIDVHFYEEVFKVYGREITVKPVASNCIEIDATGHY
jgi:hypothetical protein